MTKLDLRVSLCLLIILRNEHLGCARRTCAIHFGKFRFLFMLIATLKPTAEPPGNALAKLYQLARNHKFGSLGSARWHNYFNHKKCRSVATCAIYFEGYFVVDCAFTCIFCRTHRPLSLDSISRKGMTFWLDAEFEAPGPDFDHRVHPHRKDITPVALVQFY